MNRILTADGILYWAATIATTKQFAAGRVFRATCFASRTLVFLGTGQNHEAKQQH